jgi:serine/threonine protein kinase/Tol biopolymer transport system component
VARAALGRPAAAVDRDAEWYARAMKSTLRAGSSVSHYRLQALIGAGGMGEVYKAEDTVLGRPIALKILPPDLVRDDERVRRFVQEAKSASSLNHPHIVTVHEIGAANVRPDAEPDAAAPAETAVHYIAMEFIDGVTLRQKIHDEKTELRTLLGYLAQAAEGLAKAHASGIVHRDLKPDNIMISRDGYAKVLDFGLAKLTEAGPRDGTGTDLTTTAASPTRDGAILGTVGYMAPEQILGKALDQRADIFSFGCILYEAATGQRAFRGDSDVEVMHKILREKPPAVDELKPNVPAEVRRLIRRCLAKDPEQRHQSMKDLAIELAELAADYDQLAPGSSSSSALSAAAPAVTRGPRPRIAIAIAVLLLAAAGLAAVLLLARRAPREAPSPFANMRMASLTANGKVRAAAIAPDGKVVVQAVGAAGRHSLVVRQIATGSDIEIVPPGPAVAGIVLSPDGNYVYYTRRERDVILYSVLYRVPVLGGEARKLIFDVDTPVTFSPDGARIAFGRGYPDSNSSAILVAAADGTGERKIAERKDPATYELNVLAWSPDGTTIAAVAASEEGGVHQQLVAIDVESGQEQALGATRWADVNGLAWLPDGRGLLVTASTEQAVESHQIWHVAYPGGGLRRITNDLNNYRGVSMAADARTLVTVQTSFSSNLWLAPATDAAHASSLARDRDELVEQINWGRSGTIVFMAKRGGSYDIWTLNPATREQKRLTTESHKYTTPLPAPDGSFFLCTSVRNGGVPHVFRLDRDGADLEQLTSGAGEIVNDVSPDGQWFLYSDRATERTLWKRAVAGGEPSAIVKEPRSLGLFSPDGKHILYDYLRAEDDRFVPAAAIIPAAGGEKLWSFDAPEGVGPVNWAPSADAVTYIVTRDGVSNIWRQPLGRAEPTQITRFESGRIFSFAWSPDGKEIAFSRGEEVSDAVLLSDMR